MVNFLCVGPVGIAWSSYWLCEVEDLLSFVNVITMCYTSLFVVLFVFMVQQVQLIEIDKVLQIECLISMMTVFPAKNKIKYDDRVGDY